MATVGQAIWFIPDLITGQSNATQARRSVDDEVAVMERIIGKPHPLLPVPCAWLTAPSSLPPAAAITGSPSDAQAEQVRQLREQRDLLDARQQTRNRLRYHAHHSTHP